MGQSDKVKPNGKGTKMTSKETFELIDKAYQARIVNIKDSFSFLKEAEKLCKNNNNSIGLAIVEAYNAFFQMINGNFQDALQNSTRLLPYFQESEYKDITALLHYTIGSVNYKSDNYHIGLDHLLKCLSIRRELGDKKGESQTLKSIGTIYEYFNDYESAEEAYIQCREISFAINDKLGESNACNPLSGLYLKRGNIADALETASRSIELKQASGDKRGLAFSFHALAKVFLKQKDYENAERWFLKSLKIQMAMDEKLGIAMCEEKIGELYFYWGKYELAKKYLNQSIKSGKTINSNLILFKSYHFLYQIAKKENEAELALLYLEKHLEKKESVINADTSSIIKSFKAISKIEMLQRESRIIKEKNKHIEEKNTELDTFVYRVSHDLRGPIASLLGLYNIALQDVNDKESIKYLKLYHEQIQRLNDIILDLINLIRIKGWQDKSILIDFLDITESIIQSFKYLPNFSDIDFEIDIDKEIAFHSDKSTITTIFQNLIENSIKYSRSDIQAKVLVKVAYNDTKDAFILTVKDNGIGISKQYQDKVFDMFFRASDEKEGSGLGLYILKYAVNKLKGIILLKSAENEGTTIQITIPLLPPESAQED